MVPDLRRETPLQVRKPTDKPGYESEDSLMTTTCCPVCNFKTDRSQPTSLSSCQSIKTFLQVPGTLAIDDGANGNGRVMTSQYSGYPPENRSCAPSAWFPRPAAYARGVKRCAFLGVELGPLAETHPPTRPIPP